MLSGFNCSQNAKYHLPHWNKHLHERNKPHLKKNQDNFQSVWELPVPWKCNCEKKFATTPICYYDLWLVCFSRCNVPGKNCMIGVFIEWQTVNGTSNYRFLPFSGQILLNFLLTTHHYALAIIYYNRYHNNTYALMLQKAITIKFFEEKAY